MLAHGMMHHDGGSRFAALLRGRVLSDSEPAEPNLLTWQPAAAPVTVQPLHKSPGSMADSIHHAVMSIGGTTHSNPPPASTPPPRVGGGIRPVTPIPSTSNNCSNSNNPFFGSGLTALVKLEEPIVGFQVSVPGSTMMTRMAWVEPKAPPELRGARFISAESTVHSANDYNASWHGPVFSETGQLMAVGGAESMVALNLSELQSSRGKERGVGEEVETAPRGLLETRRIVRTSGGEEGTSVET